MLQALRTRLFRAFGDRVIARAMRTPYTHLSHDDGTPYMNRYWLLRIGMPRQWRDMERKALWLERTAALHARVGLQTSAGRMADTAAELRERLQPWFAIRVHHIVSSDERAFHDHPLNFTSLILRGGYTEVRPLGFQPHQVTLADDFDGAEASTYHLWSVTPYAAGDLIRRKAGAWHYVRFDQPGGEAWTLFVTGRVRQTWGFLADGLRKVPFRLYLARRRQRKQDAA